MIISEVSGVTLQNLSFVVESMFGLGSELLKDTKGLNFEAASEISVFFSKCEA